MPISVWVFIVGLLYFPLKVLKILLWSYGHKISIQTLRVSLQKDAFSPLLFQQESIGCECWPWQHCLICAGKGEGSPRCLWQMDVHRAIVSLTGNCCSGFVSRAQQLLLCSGFYNWRFKQLNCFLNAFVVAKIQPLQFCRSSTWNIAHWQMGLSPLTVQERGSWRGTYPCASEKLLLQLPEGAGFGPVVEITGGFYWILATLCGWKRRLKGACGES